MKGMRRFPGGAQKKTEREIAFTTKARRYEDTKKRFATLSFLNDDGFVLLSFAPFGLGTVRVFVIVFLLFARKSIDFVG
jgi:hypothetical protein